MKRFLTLLIIIGFCFEVFATHNRAGEIRYRVLSYLSFEVTIVTYTKASSTAADRDTLKLKWGDGTFDMVLRSNGPIGSSGVPQGVVLGDDIKYNEYKSGVHTYPGPLPFYIISVSDPNRISNIININGGASVNIPFHIEDTLRIFDPTFVGMNNSPILLYPPIDFACIGDTFFHNPTAFDPDGDSLSYSLVEPLQGTGFPVQNFQFPDEVPPVSQFTINSLTGEVIWATPRRAGIYNIAILVTEYRNGIRMGTVLRDMQIFVEDCNNQPPQIAEFEDTCVIAGTLLTKIVIASDPNANQSVTLTAEGGPLRVADNATFSNPAPDNPVSGVFNWQTTCAHIRRQFYEVVFRAEDNFVAPSLVDLKTWLIRVVAPPPENLQALAQNGQIVLTWNDPYPCAHFEDFIGFSIWRREGSNPFAVENCDIGLAGRGYTRIASNVTDYTYTDTDVHRGRLYCYRILAEFAKRTDAGLFYNKVESLPSNESCAELKIDLPVIKNVDVTQTGTANGSIFVAWYRPVTSPDHLDTTQFTGPYEYRLYRSPGFDFSIPVQIASFGNQFFGNLKDTTFTDTQLNTVDNPYSYQVKLFANGEELGGSDIASSVYLSIAAGDNSLELTWEEKVPWVNFQYIVFRKAPGEAAFDTLAIVETDSFSDIGLTNGLEYCYYVTSFGEYTSESLEDTLINNSQQVCAIPVDTVPPCPPVLTVVNNCNFEADGSACELGPNAFKNDLSWVNPATEGCEPVNEILKYYIYFSEPGKDSFVIITETDALNYSDTARTSLAGCFAVTAIDSFDNESSFSNIVCMDNCPCYQLPNVFTPNGDGRNDYFVPIKPYRFIGKVDMQIYNRWGTLVHETEDPEIRWDGTDINNGKPVKEGVYYYVCAVYEIRVEGLRKNSNVLSGFIHLIRGNGSSN